MASWQAWLRRDEALDPRHVDKHKDHPWYLVIWLTGVEEAIELATAVCIPYLLLNGVVLSRALIEVGTHPLALPRWQHALREQGDWTQLALGAVILFPRLALGLSGFETGVSVMPLI